MACSRRGAKGQATSGPQYAENGDLLRPTAFDTWVFVGSNLGLAYEEKPSLNIFHNNYINPEAYEYFLKNKTFPDLTVLVMDMYAALDREPQGVVTKGTFNGPHTGVQVAVKNSNRPDGSKTPWACYRFPDGPGAAQAQAEKDGMCFECHAEHAKLDHVWTQFYPILRKHLE